MAVAQHSLLSGTNFLVLHGRPTSVAPSPASDSFLQLPQRDPRAQRTSTQTRGTGDLRARAANSALIALALTFGPAFAADPVDAEAHSIAIPAGPLSQCILELAWASKLQVLYRSFLTDGLYCKGVQGRMRWTAALDLILADTPYTWGVVNARTFTIGPPQCLPTFTQVEFSCGRQSPLLSRP